MSLRERIYSVLIVSNTEKFNNDLSSLLPEARFQPIKFVSNINTAKRAWSERSYDYVLINSPLQDEIGVRFAIDVGNSSVVLLFVNADLYDDIHEKASEHGIFILPKPISWELFSLALDWMESVKERLRKLEKKNLSFEEKMQELRLINRAKWILISELKMDESQAHHFIEKRAMDRCLSKKEIAEEIIKTYI